jgi:hypothetical protein
LVLIDGQLKPNAFPFSMLADVAEVGTYRISATCSNGDTILATAEKLGDDHLSAVLAGSSAVSATLEVSQYPCAGQASTLSIEELKSVEDKDCSQQSAGACTKGWRTKSTIHGSVHKDGTFWQRGEEGAPASLYNMAFGSNGGAYVARLELTCGWH